MTICTKTIRILLALGCAYSLSLAAEDDDILGDDATTDEISENVENKSNSKEEVPLKEVSFNGYNPFAEKAYLTSSFGENRGTRYHAGIDYSTNMEEGLPIFAPENGKVKEIRTSPFGYGKVMFFQGVSGRTWVFAHQSSFGKLDAQVSKKQYATHRNDIVINPGTYYKKGDTLTFSGSSGIGNPHLHLEVRLDKDRVISPCKIGVLCTDTIAPQIFAGAVWQGHELAITSAEAIDEGCMITPVKNEFNLTLAFKIADYSREPKENPMSVRRIELWRYDEKIYSKVQDTLRYSTMSKIRNELAWTEEADTAGDWHIIRAKIAPLSKYTLEVEDFSGHVTKKTFTFHPKCKSNKPVTQVKYQTAPVYTFLGRTMLNMFLCKSGYKFKLTGDKDSVLAEDLCSVLPQKITTLGRLINAYPSAKYIQYTANAESTGDGKAANETIALFVKTKYKTMVNWSAKLGDATVTQNITGIPVGPDSTPVVMAVTRTRTDSLDFFEFHPKGMQLKNWKVCIDSKTANAPLYWLGETSRDWFIFDKQTGGKTRCASANELRDISWINSEPLTLGYPYWGDAFIGGVRQPVLKIPVQFKYAGIPNGNAISVKAKNKWVAAEYDSEPREIIIEGDKLPEAGETITIQITDEAKNKIKEEITIPDM